MFVMEPMPEILDIQPPVQYPEFPWIYLALAAGLSLLGLALCSWWAWVRRRKSSQMPLTPSQVALEALVRLQSRRRETPSDALAEELSAILRAYISAQFGLRAMHLTTPEFLAQAAQTNLITADQRSMLSAFLQQLDNWKFQPRQEVGDVETIDEAFSAVELFIRGEGEASA